MKFALPIPMNQKYQNVSVISPSYVRLPEGNLMTQHAAFSWKQIINNKKQNKNKKKQNNKTKQQK